MLNGAKTLSSTSISPCDIFAIACELKTQMQTLEGRNEQNEKVGEEFKKRRRELQDILRLFEAIEDNEKKTTKELQLELEKAKKESGFDSMAFTFKFIRNGMGNSKTDSKCLF
jgi:hypothetical protein